MLNFGASKPRVRGGGAGPPGPPLDPHTGIYAIHKLRDKRSPLRTGKIHSVFKMNLPCDTAQEIPHETNNIMKIFDLLSIIY